MDFSLTVFLFTEKHTTGFYLLTIMTLFRFKTKYIKSTFGNHHVTVMSHGPYLVIMAKNNCYLHWNQGAWWSFHNNNQLFLAPCIWCTDHLCDSCGLPDVNPHFATPGCHFYFKIKYWPIVTSSIHEPAASYCDVTDNDWLFPCGFSGYFPIKWRWGQWYNLPVMSSFCGAMNNGFDHLAAKGQDTLRH